MDKKQKSIFISIFVILLLIVLLVGFTFARYISTWDAISERYQTAKWRFDVTGWSKEETNQLSFMETVHHINLDHGLIAPGYEGYFDFEIDASPSEVDLEYRVEINEDGHIPPNLQFQGLIDGDQYTTFYSSMKELAENELVGIIKREDDHKTIPIRIYAIWPFQSGSNEQEVEDCDIADTKAGIAAGYYDYQFSIKVIGRQLRAEEVV